MPKEEVAKKVRRVFAVKYICDTCGENFVDEDISRRPSAIQNKSFSCIRHHVPVEMKRENIYQ